MFKEHEKFWAFIILVVTIALLALMSSFLGNEVSLSEQVNQAQQDLLNAKLRIIDAAVVGLIGIAGMAAQALFRHSATEQNLAEAVKSQAESIPVAPQEPIAVEVKQPTDAPIPVTETNPAPTEESDAPWNKQK